MITCHLQCNTVIVLNKHVCIVICLYIYQGSIQTPQGVITPRFLCNTPNMYTAKAVIRWYKTILHY